MKKIILALSVCAGSFFTSAFAQQFSGDVAIESSREFSRKESHSKLNAQRNFMRSFKQVSNETWHEKTDGYRATFQKASVTCMVDYDKKGRWQNTILVYNEDQLSSPLRRIVKSIYVDYSIVKIIEVKMAKKHTYFIKIEDNYTLKTLQVIDGEVVEVESYKKS